MQGSNRRGRNKQVSLRRPERFALLYSLAFLAYFATPSLIGSWKIPIPLVVAVDMSFIGFLFFSSLGKVYFPFRVHLPTLLICLVVLTVISAVGLYGSYAGAYVGRTPSLNSLIYFWMAISLALPLVALSCFRGQENPVRYVINGLYLGMTFLCVAQIILIIMGIRSPSAELLPQFEREAVLMRYLGFGAQRIVLPISSGFQAGALIPLAISVMGTVRLMTRWRAFDLFVALLGVSLLLILDVQQFVIAAFLAPIISARIFSPLIVSGMAVLAPWIYVISVSIITKFPLLTTLANARGASAYGLFSGRQFIWENFWTYLSSASVTQIVIGNGAFGQATSGLSYGYAVLFSQWPPETQLLAVLHNTYLQTIVDSGVIGLTICMVFIATVVFHTTRSSRIENDDAAAWRQTGTVVVALAIVAASEVSFSIYMKESVAILVPIAMITALYGGKRRLALKAVRSASPQKPEK